ncbi:MAG TPA: hypothetical protein VJT32_08055 [bacterium]|nr:hypothetical protein [bacterium]
MTKTTKREAFVAVLMGSAFGIGLAQEDERGYYPQVGFGTFATYDDACEKARELNTRLGLDPVDAAMIVASSMRTQNRQNRQKREVK